MSLKLRSLFKAQRTVVSSSVSIQHFTRPLKLKDLSQLSNLVLLDEVLKTNVLAV